MTDQGISPVIIVMYHFVRPIAGSSWPGIKGLERDLFVKQLAHIRRHYDVVRLADVVEAAHGRRSLPNMAAVLTFDDGYIDHYRYVFPILKEAGLSGAFFPPSSAVLERRVLDVNKVHFILAATTDIPALVAEVEAAVEEARDEFALPSLAELRARLWTPNRFDPAEVIYVKRLLQVALPTELRARIADRLFRNTVSRDEATFADDLYVSLPQLAEMASGGMEIGSHGHMHGWLDSMDQAAQSQDIDRSLEMLTAIGLDRSGFLFCYPYGAYNDETLGILRARQCAAAVTTRVRPAYPTKDGLLTLSRLDTNDLPKDTHAVPAAWDLRSEAGQAQ